MKKLTRTRLTPLLARHFFLQPKKEFREKILSTCISLLNPHLSPEDLTLQFLLECRLFENYIRPQTGNNIVNGAEVVQGLTILFDHLLEAQALEGHMMRGVVHKIAATNTLWISTINPKGKVPFSIPIPPTMTGLQANDLVFYHALETLEGTHYAPIYNPCRLFKEALHVNNIITLSD